MVLLLQARDPALGVVEVAGNDRLGRAHDGAGGRQPDLDPVRAEVALLRHPGLLVQVQRVVGAAVHAGLAADAHLRIDVHDAVRALVERRDRTDLDARRIRALIAAQHREVAAHLRERADLGVLHPGAEIAQGDVVLGLAGDRAGVASDATRVVDDETQLHGVNLVGGRGSGGPGF